MRTLCGAVLATSACSHAAPPLTNVARSEAPPYQALFRAGASWTLPCVDVRFDGEEDRVVATTPAGTVRCAAAELSRSGSTEVVRLQCSQQTDVAGWYAMTSRGLHRIDGATPPAALDRAHPLLQAQARAEEWQADPPPDYGTSSYRSFPIRAAWCTEHHEWYGGGGTTHGVCVDAGGLAGFYGQYGEGTRGFACGLHPP